MRAGALLGAPIGAFLGAPIGAFLGAPIGAFLGAPIGALLGALGLRAAAVLGAVTVGAGAVACAGAPRYKDAMSSAPASPVPASPWDDTEFLRLLAETQQFRLGRPVRVRVTPDGAHVLFLRSAPDRPDLRLYAFDVASGTVRELASAASLVGSTAEELSAEERARRERMRITTSGITGYELSRDGRTALVNVGGRVHLVAVDSGLAREVARDAFDAKLSPDGRWVSFVRAAELFVVPAAGGSARALTSGAEGHVTHALAEFVAQEEMHRFTGYWWSPDSRHLVYERADASRVEKLAFGDAADLARAGAPTPYPRPGKPNVEVSLAIVPVEGGVPTWVKWDTARYEYLADVSWQPGAPLTILVQSRDQRELLLLAVDPATGATRELLRERDEAWVNLERPQTIRDVTVVPDKHDYRWLPDGSGFLWASEREGAWQLELRAPDGALVRTYPTPGLGLRGLRHVDAAAGRMIVAAGAEPVEQRLYEIPLAGGPPRVLTPEAGFWDGAFSPAGTRALVRYDLGVASRVEVRRADGSLAGELPSVAVPPPVIPRVELAKVGEAPGFWTALVRPRELIPGRKYPVIVAVYGGPHMNVVSPFGLDYVRHQWIADHGFFVVLADGRGTPGRGRAWERAIHRRFAEVPLDDQVTALRALAAREPAMDLGRVGVYGHSFGGYVAALAVCRRPDVYKAAVVSAPVSDWLDYDTHYTERYLGIPSGDDDPVYARNGLSAYAAGCGAPMLILHGTADDNVHFNQSLKLADALFRAGKPFELVPIAGMTHMLHRADIAPRYWERVFGFLRRHL